MIVSAEITRALIEEARAAPARPPELAEGLPGAFYGEAFYTLAQDAVAGEPMRGRRGVAPSQAADVLPVDLAGWPILLVREQGGELRAFHNICRHRAPKLVGEPVNDVARIRCPWRSWTYDLEGRLLGTPQLGGAAPHRVEGFVNDELGLKPVRVAQCMDYVFVNIAGKAAPFEKFASPLDALMAPMDLARLTHDVRFVDVKSVRELLQSVVALRRRA